MIDRETQQRIKEAANIVEVVGDYVKLTRRGANYMGLCPFHNERTPSFSVSPRKNFCHCFSCKKGGSPVNFLMEKEGVSYTEALMMLAKKYNIPVRERELSDEERERMSEREAMLVAMEWATAYFHDNLYNSEEGRDYGLAYLYSRGITDEAIKKYKLGYSFEKGDSLRNKALSEGFDIDVFKKIGLVGSSAQGHDYDKFRGRVMFPIRNSSGKTVAFGGRALRGEPAKYINSSETPLYKKSNELYGIFEAKADIIKQNRVYLMEGYLDVIGSFQGGLGNAVASSGTALTDNQIGLIHRFTDNVTLIYDGDEAGVKASLRGIDMLLSHNLHIKVLLLPDGEDPDSFARKLSSQDFQNYINEHQTDFIKYKLGVLLKNAGNNPQEISEAVRSVVSSIASIPDEIERISYTKECARKVDIDEKIIAKQVAQELLRKGVSNLSQNSRRQDFTTSVVISENKDSQEKREVDAPHHSQSVDLEKEILKYCVRYAFLPLNKDEESKLVLDYISEELEADNLTFQYPSYQKIFEILNARKSEFEAHFTLFRENIEKELELEKEKFRQNLMTKGGSMAYLKNEEAKYQDIEQSKRNELIKNFTIDFSVEYLINHEEDDVREISNKLVADRHILSSIYSKGGNVTIPEEDRLMELVPRALSELRSEVLNHKIEDLQREMAIAVKEKNLNLQESIMAELTKMMYIRARIAENLGERIISPR